MTNERVRILEILDKIEKINHKINNKGLHSNHKIPRQVLTYQNKLMKLSDELVQHEFTMISLRQYLEYNGLDIEQKDCAHVVQKVKSNPVRFWPNLLIIIAKRVMGDKYNHDNFMDQYRINFKSSAVHRRKYKKQLETKY